MERRKDMVDDRGVDVYKRKLAQMKDCEKHEQLRELDAVCRLMGLHTHYSLAIP